MTELGSKGPQSTKGSCTKCTFQVVQMKVDSGWDIGSRLEILVFFGRGLQNTQYRIE